MGLRRAGGRRQAKADDRLAGDQARLFRLLRLADRPQDGGLVVPVDADGVPIARLKPLHLIDGIRKRERPIDRDLIFVMKHD
jgi:hypothetical protein